IKEKLESIKWDRHKKAGDLLKLEVTESAYIVLESNAVSFLKEIKKLGIMVMLDDFGSGMSSMSTLESFEFDVIKLDMSFVAQIGKSTRSEAIIRHTIGLSHDIGASVVAEGVENEKQLAFLRDAGCDMIQGYYFYKPMPEEEFAKLLS
ncbi:MAG: EAL domain-containing protein, partial [Lachnospiraceae bacterium]|nr:EAL domain-containing protein [Lachnospiraceae bacterium]